MLDHTSAIVSTASVASNIDVDRSNMTKLIPCVLVTLDNMDDQEITSACFWAFLPMPIQVTPSPWMEIGYPLFRKSKEELLNAGMDAYAG